ncbi:MAG: hypothetical protein B7733_06140 [Myxococcales bacterium FL481]|nr:MAG: hypothetical protein B7733_06140 [Myxococcales bacterium FL481]
MITRRGLFGALAALAAAIKAAPKYVAGIDRGDDKGDQVGWHARRLTWCDSCERGYEGDDGCPTCIVPCFDGCTAKGCVPDPWEQPLR